MSTMQESERTGGMTIGRSQHAAEVNVGDAARIGSAVAGGVLAIYGISRGSLGGWLVALLGGVLAYRGLTGHCGLYKSLGVDTTGSDARPVEGNLGIKIDEAITVQATPERVYAVWRNFENLPKIMSHVERVEVLDGTRSRWHVKGPAGIPVPWEAEIINAKPNELIAWRTRGNPWVDHAGSVRFEPAGEGRTTVRVSLQYDPPAGKVGHALASVLGSDPATQIEQDLASFKRAMEAGELAP